VSNRLIACPHEILCLVESEREKLGLTKTESSEMPRSLITLKMHCDPTYS
jgi:hypothetical protein